MASFLRAKQAGMQNDLSAGIPPGQFAPDEQKLATESIHRLGWLLDGFPPADKLAC